MRKVAFAALLALGLAAPAFAQDAPPAAPTTTAPDKPPFDGFRVGALLGWDGLRPGSGPGSSITDGNGADGLLYGGDIGYDKTIGHVVIGAEGEANGSTAKATNSPVNGLGFGRVKTGRDLYVGARVGLLASPTTLVYVKGGYTNARLDLTASNGTTETGDHFNLDGYRVGAGVEHAISAHTFGKIEYRYSNYGNARFEYASGGNTNNFSVDTDRHQVVVGFGWRF